MTQPQKDDLLTHLQRLMGAINDISDEVDRMMMWIDHDLQVPIEKPVIAKFKVGDYVTFNDKLMTVLHRDDMGYECGWMNTAGNLQKGRFKEETLNAVHVAR